MVTKEKDEELALFLEMRRREKDKTNILLRHHDNNINHSNGVDASSGTNNGAGSPVSKIVFSVPARKTAAEKFLDSENDKSDYDWLLTPPGTPLFPSLEMESQKTVMSQLGMSNARPTALKARMTNIQEEPASRTNIASKRTTPESGINSSNSNNRRPSSSGGPTSATRPATPTGRPTLPSSAKPSRSRPSTPTSRATVPSANKPAGSTARSSTPTRTSVRSSTPASRPSLPASKSRSRPATPTRQMSTPSGTTNGAVPPGGRSLSVTKSVPETLKKPVPSRGSSPTVKSRPWKPNEMPGFSLDAPPNLRTSLPERPASASRGRNGGGISRSSSIEAGPKVKPRQQSCSPARGRASNGSRISITTKSRAYTSNGDDVNPVLMGTKMVERVVNMRKLAPPKQDDYYSHNNSGGKSSSLDSSGFGRSLSKKSLDMAMRHMDIRRSISGNLAPLTSIPASSVYSVRSGGSNKSKTTSGLDSPHATSSNASSEPSVNNSSFFVDGMETEDREFGSETGHSPFFKPAE